jgi:hypothetical protein
MNLATKMPQIWFAVNVFTPERRARLAEPFEFNELISRLQSEVKNVRYKNDKGSHEAKGCWRPIIWFDVEEATFDCFFNSPYGYRGQYLLGADVGRNANSQLIAILSPTLVKAVTLSSKLKQQVQRSIESPLAKIWIEEEQDLPRKPELIVQIVVPGWVDAARAIHNRLVNGDTSLTSKEVDRIYGVRAPLGCTLKVMGAWVGPDDSLSIVTSKLRRAEEIKEYGIS